MLNELELSEDSTVANATARYVSLIFTWPYNMSVQVRSKLKD